MSHSRFLTGLIRGIKNRISGSNLLDSIKARGMSLMSHYGPTAKAMVKSKGEELLSHYGPAAKEMAEKVVGDIAGNLAKRASMIGQGAPYTTTLPFMVDAAGTFPQGSHTGGDGRLLMGSDQPGVAQRDEPRPIIRVNNSPPSKEERGLFQSQFSHELAKVTGSKANTFGQTGTYLGEMGPTGGVNTKPLSSAAGWYFEPVGSGTQIVDKAPGYGEQHSATVLKYVKGEGNAQPVHEDYNKVVPVVDKDEETYEERKKRQKEKYRIKRDRERLAKGKLPKYQRVTYKKIMDERGKQGDPKIYEEILHGRYDPSEVYNLSDEKRKRIKVPKNFEIPKTPAGVSFDDYAKQHKPISKEELAARRKQLAAKKKKAKSKK